MYSEDFSEFYITRKPGSYEKYILMAPVADNVEGDRMTKQTTHILCQVTSDVLAFKMIDPIHMTLMNIVQADRFGNINMELINPIQSSSHYGFQVLLKDEKSVQVFTGWTNIGS